MEQLRIHNISDPSKVRFALVETNGQLSFVLEPAAMPATAQMLSLSPGPVGVPVVLISDGRLLSHNLNRMGRDRQWLTQQLKEQKIRRIRDVFLMTLDECGHIFLQKEGGGRDETRVVCLAALAVITAACLLSDWYVTRQSASFLTLVDRAEQQAQQGSPEQALTTMEQLQEQWDRQATLMGSLIRHAEIDEAEQTLAGRWHVCAPVSWTHITWKATRCAAYCSRWMRWKHFPCKICYNTGVSPPFRPGNPLLFAAQHLY